MLIGLRLVRSRKRPCLPQIHLSIRENGANLVNVCKYRLRSNASVSNNGLLCIRQNHRASPFANRKQLIESGKPSPGGPSSISEPLIQVVSARFF